MPAIRRYQRKLRALRELQKMVEELEKTEPQWSVSMHAGRNRSLLKRYKSQLKKLSKSKACSDTGLLDVKLLSRTMEFYSSAAEVLIGAMTEHVSKETGLLEASGSLNFVLPLKEDTPAVFAALPEWIIDDIADFLIFAMQYFSNVISESLKQPLLTFLLMIVCTPSYFNNPYLGEVLTLDFVTMIRL